MSSWLYHWMKSQVRHHHNWTWMAWNNHDCLCEISRQIIVIEIWWTLPQRLPISMAGNIFPHPTYCGNRVHWKQWKWALSASRSPWTKMTPARPPWPNSTWLIQGVSEGESKQAIPEEVGLWCKTRWMKEKTDPVVSTNKEISTRPLTLGTFDGKQQIFSFDPPLCSSSTHRLLGAVSCSHSSNKTNVAGALLVQPAESEPTEHFAKRCCLPNDAC